MNSQYSRERTLYLIALLLLLINRVLARFPNSILPDSVVSNEGSWLYIAGPAFSYVAIIYCIIATWRFFQYAGISGWASVVNALVSPLLFPLVYVPQMIYVLRRARKINNAPAQEEDRV
jgi:hypothetical protein